jgi:hypothetical protein
VTSHPIAENAGHWWLCCGKWRRLHAIPGPDITPEQIRDAIDENRPLQRRATCGLRRGWWMPGIGSRLGLRRCSACCQTLGVPHGHGTPANEAD